MGNFNSSEWPLAFNRDISVKNDDDFRAKKIVFVITFSPKRDNDYFEYFSYDNLFGHKKNAYFFRDIINYKNTSFSGTPKSWIAYHTALKRFFSFYCGSVGNYRFDGNPYDDIQLRHFKAYIESRNSIKSKKTSEINIFIYGILYPKNPQIKIIPSAARTY